MVSVSKRRATKPAKAHKSLDTSRVVLLLQQGSMTPFMKAVAESIDRMGATALRINFSSGEQLLGFKKGSTNYRGSLKNWPRYLTDYIERMGVTDLAMTNDCREYHEAAIIVARKVGVRVHVIEQGYLRPDWLTVERDGMGSFSHFPKDPSQIEKLAHKRKMPDLKGLFASSFKLDVKYDLKFNLANLILTPFLFPHYRRHTIHHPLLEYGSWLWRLVNEKKAAKKAASTIEHLKWHDGPVFLLPLQLSTDYQIRTHSPFDHQRDAVKWVVQSFARHAPRNAHLLVKVHPLDSGLEMWPLRIAAMARKHGVADRVSFIDGGSPVAIMNMAAGVVLVNSTIGIQALYHNLPVMVLGGSVYDMPGLTHQGSLASFWSNPTKPDRDLVIKFMAALTWTTQVRGAMCAPDGVAVGARNVAIRVLEKKERLPRTKIKTKESLVFRVAAEWRREMKGETEVEGIELEGVPAGL